MRHTNLASLCNNVTLTICAFLPGIADLAPTCMNAQVKPTGDVSAWALFDVSQLAPPPAMPHPYLHSHAVATRNLQVRLRVCIA